MSVPYRVPGPEELADDLRELSGLVRQLDVNVQQGFAKLDERFLTRNEFNLYWGFLRQEQTRVDGETKAARDRSAQSRVIALTGLLFPVLVGVVLLVLTQLVQT